MSSCLCECREGGREHEGKDEDYSNGIRACSNCSFDGEPVKQPDRYHEQSQDDCCDDHCYASGYAASVVVVDVLVIRLFSCLLLRDH